MNDAEAAAILLRDILPLVLTKQENEAVMHAYSNLVRASSLLDTVREYLAALEAFEEATRPLSMHAHTRRLPHGDPIILRLRTARTRLTSYEAAPAPAATPLDSLLQRIRSGSEVAPWVYDELVALRNGMADRRRPITPPVEWNPNG